MAKNTYLEKQATIRQGYFIAGLQSGRQQILDMVSLVLRDQKIMGKDVFGKDRLLKVVKGVGEYMDKYDLAWQKHETSDAARYKALGNSIALPPWKWVLKRLCAQYERDATMASLFDGIGGFPLLWEQLNGEGSCLWASEIEEFPMAVTKLRFSPTGQKG